MPRAALVGARVLDPEQRSAPQPETLLVEDGRILERLPAQSDGTPPGPGEDWPRVDLGGHLLAPGFLDLHFHGEIAAAPVGRFAAVLDRAARAMLRGGTTGFLATTMAWSSEQLGPFVAELARAIAAGGTESGANDGARCLGLHLEGPWISDAAAGAMSASCLRAFEPRSDGAVLDRAEGHLRMVTLAPEREGAGLLLAELARRGVVAALGHTRASRDEIHAGIDQGLRHVTHLFNAMGPVHHREPGVAGAALACDALTCDLICDGHHVHPDMIRVAARALRERLVLITDRVDLSPPEAADPSPDGAAPVRLADGTLAGSQLTLDAAVRNAARFADLDLKEAVAACTLRPAQILGIESECGTLRPGARADLAVLDERGIVVETWVAGQCVWKAPELAS